MTIPKMATAPTASPVIKPVELFLVVSIEVWGAGVPEMSEELVMAFFIVVGATDVML